MQNNILEKIFSWQQAEPDTISQYLYNDNQYLAINLSAWLNDVKAIANYLINHFPSRSNIVIAIPSENCHDFLTIFIATLAANMVAVPIAPPENNDAHNLANQRINNIFKQINASLIISSDKILQQLQSLNNNLLPKKITIDYCFKLSINTNFTLANLPQHEPAFIQYTSGSTGEAKGVMITHANIMANIRAMGQRLHDNNIAIKHVVNWLPHFHDMGLISGMLLPLYLNIPAILIPTKQFIKEPMLWLKTISNFPNVLSGGPDFAYSLCVRSAKRGIPNNINLLNWEIAFIGAQMIQADTFINFKNIFQEYGFREKIFYPCYGLAESTLYATGGNIDLLPKTMEIDQNTRVFCVGKAFAEHKVIIVDPESKKTLLDHKVGEIWLQGPSIAAGYYKDPVTTDATFNATTAEGHAYFLRTGDLGLLDNGELYVVGRLKDMVIVHGKNYACTDLEWCAVQAHAALRENHCAAFSTCKDGKNICVIIAEINPQFFDQADAIKRSIREALSLQLGIKVNDIVLTKPRMLAKTSSGKLRRFQIKSDYLDRKFSALT
jgi:acyl-CoA synthetase (AMP-forming)/AMP-acid ligase II